MGRRTTRDLSASLLLDLAAKMIADDRSYHAPSLERETVARLVGDASRFGILASDRLVADLGIFAKHLQAAWTESCAQRGAPHADSGQADILSMGLLAQIAVDNIVAREWLSRASQSRHFQRRLEDHQQTDKSSRGERLARALRQAGVVEALLTSGLLKKGEIAALVRDLEVRDTRSFLQRYLKVQDASSALMLEDDEQTDSHPVAEDPNETVVAPKSEHLVPGPKEAPALPDGGAIKVGDDLDVLEAQYSSLGL